MDNEKKLPEHHTNNMTVFKKLHRYGLEINSYDLIKAIAITTMIIDHLGLYIFDNQLWFRVIGRSAAPLFFFITGYVGRSKFKWNILIYGLILSLITYFTEDKIFFNILVNFVLIKWVLNYYQPEKLSNRLLPLSFILMLAASLFISPYLEYGLFGLMFAFGARLISVKDDRGPIWLAATVICYFLYESLVFSFFQYRPYEYVFIAICLILFNTFFWFRMRKWEIKKIMHMPILILSRYSLEIYFIHLALLKISTFVFPLS